MKRIAFIVWFHMSLTPAIRQPARLQVTFICFSTGLNQIYSSPVMTTLRSLTAKSFMLCCMIRRQNRVLRFRESLVGVVNDHLEIDSTKQFDDVTLITILTLNRQDRLPYLMKRWKHRIMMSIMIMESEIPNVIKLINDYKNYQRITYLLYIIKEKPSFQGRSIFFDSTGPTFSNETIFPINLLRDLAIESIETTHYFVSDIDVFTSETLYKSLMIHNETLHDPKAVLLLKLFLMNEAKIDHERCYKEGRCNYMYCLWSS